MSNFWENGKPSEGVCQIDENLKQMYNEVKCLENQHADIKKTLKGTWQNKPFTTSETAIQAESACL